MFENIGMPEIILILLIIMIFFGAGKLPEVASGLGKAIGNFKKAQRGDFDKEDEAKAVETTANTVETPVEPVKTTGKKSKKTSDKPAIKAA
jgi:sec-independent protein translocase protein TatA